MAISGVKTLTNGIMTCTVSWSYVSSNPVNNTEVLNFKTTMVASNTGIAQTAEVVLTVGGYLTPPLLDSTAITKTVSKTGGTYQFHNQNVTLPAIFFNANGVWNGEDGENINVIASFEWNGDQLYPEMNILPPQIDRKSYPTITPNSGELQDVFTINTNRKASSFTHKLEGKMSGQSTYETLATEVTDTIQYSIPESYADYAPNQRTAQYEIKCTTYDPNGNNLGSASAYYSIDLATESLKPKIANDTLSDAAKMSDNATTYLQKFGAFVYGKSQAVVALTETYMHQATFVSREIKIGNTRLSNNPAIFEYLPPPNENPTLSAFIVDSRSARSDEYSKAIEVLAYEAPKLSSTPEVFRSDSTGVKDNTNGTYIAVKTSWSKSTLERNGVVQNFVRLRIYMNDSIVHDSGSVSSDSDKNGEKIIVAGAQIASTYTMKVVLTDTAETEISYKTVVGPATRVMSFKADKTGVAIGKMSDKAGFEVQWDTDINGDLNVDGDANFNGRVDGILNADTIALFRELTGITNQGGVMLDVILQTMLKNLPQVGDYWTTETTETPESHFGFGTWVKVTDRMLVGAGNSYSVSAEGGAATHILTVDQIPSHQHPMGTETNPYVFATSDDGTGSDIADSQAGTEYKYPRVSRSATIARAAYDRPCGGGTAHNNMPPYRAVNIWRRTA